MSFKKIASERAEKALELGLEIARPLIDVKIAKNTDSEKEVDTQDLAQIAAHIIETNPARALFASQVMVELDAGNITAERASYYLTPPIER